MESKGENLSLSADDQNVLREMVERFDTASRAGKKLDLGAFLPRPGSPLRLEALIELVQRDLENRGKRGQSINLAVYLEKFPELGTAKTLTARLIYAEYRARQLFGDKPLLSAYRNRFADQFDELQKLVEAKPIVIVTRDEIHLTNRDLTSAGSGLQDTSPIPVSEDVPTKAPPSPRQMNQLKADGAKGAGLALRGGYKLLKQIGSGGFGAVWLGESPGDIRVAIKELFRPMDHEEAQRELQSLELIKGLRHPFLLQTQAFWAEAERLYIVMELADGSLRDRLKECRKANMPGIPVAELMTYMREAAEALDFLHSRKVMHRDIKPENILVLQKHAKVADFGLAREQQSEHMQSATGSGTPIYMAPEVWRNKSSPRSDQYSLALTYAELRLDRRLVSGTNLIEIMELHTEKTPDLQPLSAAEQAPILRALSKDPEARFQTCLEFARELDRAIALDTRTADHPLTVPSNYRLGDRSKGSLADGSGTVEITGGGGARSVGDRTQPLDSTGRPVGVWHGSQTAPVLPAPAATRKIMVLACALATIGLAALGVAGMAKYRQKPPPPAEPALVVPAGCIAAEGAKIVGDHGQRYPDRVIRVRGELRIPFVLIPRTRPTDPPTFFIMENKVSTAQFLAAVANPEFQAILAKHSKDNPWTVQKNWEKEGQAKDPDWPATNITVTEAHCFAEWLGGLLPSVQEWNKAAGFFEADRDEKGTGPFEGFWDPSDATQIAVRRQKRQGPLPVGTATKDISRFGCRDMAGNGVEWTRNTMEEASTVPLPRPDKETVVRHVGRDYTSDSPLTFADIKDDAKGSSGYYKDCDSGLGFRVVLVP